MEKSGMESYSAGVVNTMNDNKLNRVWIIVTLAAEHVVIDGPNVHTDNYCLRHKLRYCSRCLINSKWDTNDEKYWDRTLDIERLPIVSDYVKKRGYKPKFFILDGTHQYLLDNRKTLPEIKPKLRIMDRMIRKKEIILLDREKWKKQGKVVDDIWWITFALEIDALILTNDQLRDWKPGGKYERTDLNWEDIENRRIEFSFEPKHARWNKFGDKCEEQVFTAAELETLAEMDPSQKKEMLELELQASIEKTEKIRQLMESLAKTTPDEINQGHDFFGYEEQIIDAWLAAFEVKEGILVGEFTSVVWKLVVGYICGLNWYHHIECGGDIITWMRHQKFDEELAKKNLGYSSTESHIRILENQFNLLENRTEFKFKFSPDQKSLLLLNPENLYQKKEREEE